MASWAQKWRDVLEGVGFTYFTFYLLGIATLIGVFLVPM